MARRVRVALIGLGNVGCAFLGLMSEKRDVLAQQYGIELILTGAADSKAAIVEANGIDHEALRAHKTGGQTLTTFPQAVPGLSACQMAERVEADIVLGAAATNLRTGQPGLESTLMALGRGIPVVLADKGPLVHGYTELQAAAQEHRAQLAFSATVCGALPVVNIGQRDLAACRFHRVRGIFNSTSNYILDALRRGESYEDALRQAQEAGVAEADPTLDVEGWDTANKLVIIANAILGQQCTLTDVGTIRGIMSLDPAEVAARARQGEIVRLIAQAVPGPASAGYALSVQPEWLPAGDFLAGVQGWEMGIVFETDIMGVQQFKVDERGPIPTAAAMLRDLLRIVGN